MNKLLLTALKAKHPYLQIFVGETGTYFVDSSTETVVTAPYDMIIKKVDELLSAGKPLPFECPPNFVQEVLRSPEMELEEL